MHKVKPALILVLGKKRVLTNGANPVLPHVRRFKQRLVREVEFFNIGINQAQALDTTFITVQAKKLHSKTNPEYEFIFIVYII